MKTRFSAEAQGDLDAIFDYGVRQFGIVSADRYLESLIERIERVVEFPLASEVDIGRNRTYRRVGCGSHFIYFRVEDDALWIVRILHKTMLQSRHLG